MSVATPALPVRAERLWAALAATLMNLPLGSVYAFSVRLRPIESADRTSHRSFTLITTSSCVCLLPNSQYSGSAAV